MKILAHEPRRNDKLEHLAIRVDGIWVALCQSVHESSKTSNGVWIVRDKQDGDCICSSCEAKQEKLNNPPEPKPPLPCNEPGKKLKIWERIDGDALVHAAKSRHVSHCGNVRDSFYSFGEWQMREGVASEVTCERCSKAAGLHPQAFVYREQEKKKQGESRQARDRRLWARWTGAERDESNQR